MNKLCESISADEFDNILLEAIDEAFSCLGETSKNAIYSHLRKEFGIERDDIPNQIEAFLRSLEKLLGLGARLLETMFMRHLKAKLNDEQDRSGLDLLVPKFTFQEYVLLKRRHYGRDSENNGLTTLVGCEEKKEQQVQ